MRRYLLLFLHVFFLQGCVSTPDALVESSSSQLLEGEESLKGLIEFPEDIEDVDFVVSCSAIIAKNGFFKQNWCFPNGNPMGKKLISAIHIATRKAKNSTAIHDGKKVEVLFSYRVRFYKDGGASRVDIYPNDGFDTDRYGDSYYSAQRVLHRRFIGRRPNNRCYGERSIFYIVSEIGTFGGAPMSVKIEGTERCEDRWLREANQREFISAKLSGTPIVSEFREAFFRNLRKNKVIFRQNRGLNNNFYRINEEIKPMLKNRFN